MTSEKQPCFYIGRINIMDSPNFNKELPFRVPKGYFDKLPQRILENCTPSSDAKRTPWRTVWKSQLAFAAGFAALAVVASLVVIFSQKFSAKQMQQNNTYIEIVGRNIYNDSETPRTIHERNHEIDSLNVFTNGMFLRYYSPRNKFSTICEEKHDAHSLK